MPKKIDELKIASKDLGLTFEEQDWGIINSDELRVKEFIDYFNKNYKTKSNTFKYYMFELIVASFNDAIIEKKTEEIETVFKDFVDSHKNEEVYQSIFSYWIRIRDDEFPVGEYLT